MELGFCWKPKFWLVPWFCQCLLLDPGRNSGIDNDFWVHFYPQAGTVETDNDFWVHFYLQAGTGYRDRYRVPG